jgi:hypothetical protein
MTLTDDLIISNVVTLGESLERAGHVVKNGVFGGVLRRVAVVRTDLSEELSATINRVTRSGELGTTLAACVSC